MKSRRLSINPTRNVSHSGTFTATILCLLLAAIEPSFSLIQPSNRAFSSSKIGQISRRHLVSLYMVMSAPGNDTHNWSRAEDLFVKADKTKRRVRKKYKRKRMPETERERRALSKDRQAKYEQLVSNADGGSPSLWGFESLFPKPVWDEATVQRDLYEIRKRDTKIERLKEQQSPKARSKMKTSAIGASSMMRVWREPKLSSYVLPYDAPDELKPKNYETKGGINDEEAAATVFEPTFSGTPANLTATVVSRTRDNVTSSISETLAAAAVNTSGKVDFQLTRMVEDRMYGYRRGTDLYDISLMGEGAIKFRGGVRLGNPIAVNADRLNYHAKRELRNSRVEEAQELYERAIQIDPRDGRAYLGLSRCAERRRDFKLARECLNYGIANSASMGPDGTPDIGANPFLLQALGCWEEKAGHLAEAEKLYIEAARSRPSHAAAWVALAQLRTRKFRQGAASGRACYQAAERELKKAGMPPSSYVYTAWASLEYKKCGDVRLARNLFRKALEADKRCSAAWLQLGVMEAAQEHWREAELCFETVLKFDQRNTRILQAYAIMESKRPESQSRKVIGLFERALKMNSRDAGVFQAYGLFVAQLGDVDSARDLLQRGSEVDKRHAAVWQAWGVLETRHGTPEDARNVFQQGIWACAQLAGGQSGGYKCARLWQAWGVLEAQEGDFAAARRCFSRALDADKRNVAATTAWTLMEEEIGNLKDVRVLFERAIKQFAAGTDEKKRLWTAYESMEKRIDNTAGAQEVYRRAVRESFGLQEEQEGRDDSTESIATDISPLANGKMRPKETETDREEIEVSRWDQGGSSMKAEIWMNDGSIEGKVPKATMNKNRRPKKDLSSK